MYKLVIIVNFISCLCFAQNIKQELLNINKAFLKNTNIGIISTTKAFVNGESKTHSETKMEVYKWNNNSLTRYENTEVMVNTNYKINVNDKNKIITINKINPKIKNDKESISKFNDNAFYQAIDTVLSVYKEVKINKINEFTNEIVFVFKSGMYDKVSVSYDRATYFIKTYRVALNANNVSIKKQKVTNYDITNVYLSNDVLKKIKFDEKQYVTITNENIVPSKKYSGFTIINNIKKG